MYEKRRSLTRFQPKSAHAFFPGKSQSTSNSLTQPRESMKPICVNALPSLMPADSDNPFFQLKTSYNEMANSVSQFVSHTSSTISYRTSLALLMKDVDSLFQNFCLSVSKIVEDSDRFFHHGHANITNHNNVQIHQFNSTLIPHKLPNTPQIPSEHSVDDGVISEIENYNYSQSEKKIIKNSTDPFLFAWCKFIKQIISIQSTGFSAIIDGITSHFNNVFKHVDRLNSLQSMASANRENLKKIVSSLRTKTNEVHSLLRKLIQQSKLIPFTDHHKGDQQFRLEFNDNQQLDPNLEGKGKQIVNNVHDLSQMFASAFTNDFSLSLSSQELDLCRNDVLASFNEIIQGIRSIILFDTDMLSLSVSVQKFQNRLQFFVYSNNGRFPTEEELENDTFLNQNENRELNQTNEQVSNNTQNDQKENDNQKAKLDDFDENMNMQELIQVGENNFLKKNLSDYSQMELNTAMLRFFSLLKGKIVDVEEKYRKAANEHLQNQIKTIRQHHENRMKDFEATVKSLNETIINKNFDIQFLQNNPALNFLQEAVNIIYQENGDLVIPPIDLADPQFMTKLASKIKSLKGHNSDQDPTSIDVDNLEPLHQNPLNSYLHSTFPSPDHPLNLNLIHNPLKQYSNNGFPSMKPNPLNLDSVRNLPFLSKSTDSFNSNPNTFLIKQNLMDILNGDIMNVTDDDLFTLTTKCKEKVEQLEQEKSSYQQEIERLTKTNEILKKSLSHLSDDIDFNNLDESQINEQIIKLEKRMKEHQISPSQNEIDQSKNDQNLKEKINQIFGLTPGQTVDDQLKYIAKNRKNETELITRFQSVCHEVEDSLSLYLNVEKSDIPLIESIQRLLKMLIEQKRE